MLKFADSLREADKLMRQAITPRTLNKIVDLIPEEWLIESEPDQNPEEVREGYKKFLTNRLANSGIFTQKAILEREALLKQ